ncbi:MAG: phosphoglycerate dehydrogenase, partial [Calditrichaeota bacterium]|nr:phosphoglycerate dehydrogenase [Calditrichota bacterium]
MFRILVADSLPEDILARYNRAEGIEVANKSGISKEDLIQELPQYNGLVVRSRTKVTAEVLAAGTNLKIIGRAGAGVDNIDTAEATRRGIIVMNTPGGNTVAATEHTVALMLAMLRNIPQAHASMRESKWDRKKYLGHELYEKTIGIVGLGKIGREVAKRLAAFGSKLIGYDPILNPDIAKRLGVTLVSFEELLRDADIITMHVPKMAETMNMINAESLSHCKDGVFLVNCARGGIINEGDLVAALDSGKVAMAAIDVFQSEPPSEWALAN